MPCNTPPSEKQLAANRRNAQRSTGPRTPEGKARSRWNALKHGVLSKALIPEPLAADESRRDYDRLLQSLREELGCSGVIEEMLVERIAVSYWRLGRVARAEAGAIADRRIGIPNRLQKQQETRHMLDDLTVPERLVKGLKDSLDDTERLRAVLVCFDEGHATATGPALRRSAEQLIEHCNAEIYEEGLRLQRIEQDRCSIPGFELAKSLSRYEVHLQRQIDRALDQLCRLQRLRLDRSHGPEA